MITYGSTTLTSYNSIVRTEVYYYKSTSATSLSGGSWSTTKPTWENGKYIWQKIRTVYEDGTHSESDPVNITGQQGATGTAAYSYKLNSSDSIIGKTKDGEYTIKKITFSATYKQGTGAVSAYGGRFKIESTTNGSTWKTEYTSSGNESSKEFTIPDDIILIKCSLYQSDGTTVLLDIVTVPVVKDGVDAIGLRDSIPYYLASDKDTGITRLTQGWTRYRPQLTAEKKYLWVYYVSRYSEGTTEPELIEIKDDLVHFENNGNESPVESCVVDIEPKQDLNGYDHPWPAGGSVNLLPPAVAFTETKNGITLTSNGSGVYTLKGTASASASFTFALSDVYVMRVSDYLHIRNTNAFANGTITLMTEQTSLPYLGLAPVNRIYHLSDASWAEDGLEITRLNIYVGANSTVDMTLSPSIEVAGDTTDFVPYSNICPITGWTGAKVTRAGKNLLNSSDPDYGNYTIGPDGTYGSDTNRIATGFIPCTEGISLTFSTNKKTDGVGTDVQFAFAGIAAYDNDKNFLTRATVNNKRTVTFTTPTGTKYVRAFEQITISGSAVTITPTDFATYEQQLELGSTVTDYEPYQGSTYDITFPSESGTVYGGQLNVTTGELVVDRAMVVIDGVNKTVRENGITSMTSNAWFSSAVGKAYGRNNFISDRFATGIGIAPGGMSGRDNSIGVEFLLPTDIPNNSTALNQWFADNPTQLCYELAEPITYTLTPQEITMLCKENNIWADTGQTAISYYDNQTSTDPYVDYSLTSAFDAAVDAIEVGGRNLLKWTTKPKANGTYYIKNPEETDGWYAWNSSLGAITETDNGIKFTHNSSTTSAGIVIPLVSLNAVIGETEYVLSFKYRTNLISIGSPYLLCQTDGNISYSQAISIIQSETEWKYFNYKIQWSSSSGRNTWAILIPYINTSNGWIEIQNGSMKLEKGNKPTDWTPAPEDIDSSISTAQTTADEALAATQPISSKIFTDIIGTANDLANASFYFAKVHPTTYTDPWMVKMKIKASVPSDTNFRKTVDITIHGCRSNFISYDSIVANYNSNPIYYLNLYRATQAGIETNKKGHALGFGLRSSTSPTDTNKKRTFEVDLLEVDGCTVDWIDTPVKYADMDGTGSTNYVGCTELGITSNGQNATNNDNTYDRIKYSTIKAAEAIARYNIIVGTSAGYKHLKSGTPWDITYPILYADAALNANATGSSNYLTIPFTVTTTQAITLTPYKPVYIEGTLDGTTFTPIDTTPLTQTVPTSDNGHHYILLGSAYSTTAINLEAEHPIYQFQNGNFVTVAEAASRIGANAENLLKATYAVCSTAAGTNAKTADCMNFELYEGARIQVTFTNANTASAPTLNINNTGAKAIYINKTVASDTNQLLWTAGSKMEFVYDGTGWVAQNVPYALYGTCSTGASTAAKDVTCNEAVICKGTTISVNMTNTNTAANATMNVGSTLAKDIYANGAKLTTNSRFNWRANTTQKFVFDGQVWRMDDDSVKALATAYITEIDDDGIMVHPEDDSTSGWAISDAIQLFKSGISYIKLWIENNIPKIRIGKEDQGHIILDNDSVDIRNDNKVLASFGATSVIGDENDWHQTIAANQITFAKGDDIITYISPDKLYTINAEVADAFYISNYSIRNASDGKLVIGLRR